MVLLHPHHTRGQHRKIWWLDAGIGTHGYAGQRGGRIGRLNEYQRAYGISDPEYRFGHQSDLSGLVLHDGNHGFGHDTHDRATAGNRALRLAGSPLSFAKIRICRDFNSLHKAVLTRSSAINLWHVPRAPSVPFSTSFNKVWHLVRDQAVGDSNSLSPTIYCHRLTAIWTKSKPTHLVLPRVLQLPVAHKWIRFAARDASKLALFRNETRSRVIVR